MRCREDTDPRTAEQLLPHIYDELRALAVRRLAREAPGQTLQATALVHEASFNVSVGVAVPAGQVITATATEAGGDTSPFSNPVTVV